jgi:Transposase IS66 family
VVTSQTLWDQIEQLAWLVESVMPRLLTYVLGQSVVGGDETTWELMGKKAGESKSWYVWVLRTPDAVYYAIRGGRGVDDHRGAPEDDELWRSPRTAVGDDEVDGRAGAAGDHWRARGATTRWRDRGAISV